MTRRKTCFACKKAKPAREFYDVRTATRDGLSIACKQCDQEYRFATGIRKHREIRWTDDPTRPARSGAKQIAKSDPRANCPACKGTCGPALQARLRAWLEEHKASRQSVEKLAALGPDARLNAA